MNKESQLKSPFVMTVLISLTFGFGTSIDNLILPLLMRSNGYSMLEIGLVAMASSFGYAFFEPLTGLLYDRIGMKKIVIVATLGRALIVLLFPRAGLLWQFMGINFLGSVASAGISSPTRANIGHSTSQSKRGKGYGVYMAIQALGRIFGPILGGYLAQTMSYAVPFYASSIAYFASCLIALQLPKKEEIQVNPSTQKVAQVKFRTILAGGLILVLLMRFTSVLNTRLNNTILPVYIKENPKIQGSETEIGLIIGAMSVVSMISMMFFGILFDRFGRKKIIFSGAIMCCSAFIIFLAVENITHVLISVAILAAGEAILQLGLIVVLTDVVPRSYYGTAIGLYGLSEDIGGVISSVLFGFIYDTWGVAFVFYVLIVNMLFAASIAITSIKDRLPT